MPTANSPKSQRILGLVSTILGVLVVGITAVTKESKNILKLVETALKNSAQTKK